MQMQAEYEGAGESSACWRNRGVRKLYLAHSLFSESERSLNEERTFLMQAEIGGC